jgi:hypothetical protein
MAFLPLLPTSGARIHGKRLRIIVERTGRQLDRRRITFSISRELADALNWQAADRIVIALGIGADRGLVQLTRVEKSTAGHKLSTTPNCKVLRCAVTIPVILHGEDISTELDTFLDPAAVDFSLGDGVLTAILQPLRTAAHAPEPAPLRSVA